MLSLSIAVLFFLTIFNYIIGRDVAYPPFIQSVLWLTLLSAFSVFETDFYQTTDVVFLGVMLASVGFTAGGLLSCTMQRKDARRLEIIPSERYLHLLNFLFLLALAALPAFLWRLLTIAGYDLSADFFYRLREELVRDDGANMFGIGYYFYFCSLVFILRYIAQNSLKSGSTLIYLLLPLAVSILFVAKGFALFILSSTLGITLIKGNNSPIKSIAVASAITLLVFLALILVRSTDSNQLLESTLETVKIYSLAGLPALSELTKNGLEGGGENVFRNILVWLNRVGIGNAAPPLVQSFVHVPYGTNVFTYLRPYLIDFGLLGVCAFNVLLGFIHGLSFLKARKGSAFHIALYALLCYPLIMQFFDDQYFQILSLWIYFTIFLAIFFGIAPYRTIHHNERK